MKSFNKILPICNIVLVLLLTWYRLDDIKEGLQIILNTIGVK